MSRGDDRYGLDALPYGIFSVGDEPPRVGVRLGDRVVDLAALAVATGAPYAGVFAAATLNPFMALGRPIWSEVRSWIRTSLTDKSALAEEQVPSYPLSEVTMRLPIAIGDYVDFYASEQHATHVGQIFRPGSDPLTPNWKHLPIGYHGRSGTVVVNGTDIVRPQGQRKAPADEGPTFGPSTRLDFEAELAYVIGKDSSWPTPVPIEQAEDYLFGVVILNDWSARDIQAWEYVPLGPFLGKSFASSISAWVLPWEALKSAEFPLPVQDPAPLPYLDHDQLLGLDIQLEVWLNGELISSPTAADLYWSPAQMLAHLTINGASTRVGDLLGSGTISGQQRESWGSLLELSWGGTEPITLADGTTRTFLEDGDTVLIRASAGGIALGDVSGKLRESPAR